MHLPINRVRFPGGQMERLRLVSTWNTFHSGKASVMVLECVEDKAKGGIVSGRRGKRVRGKGTREVGETMELKTY